jgi:tRNA/tmRNA/rRNA uracil-C5-methylase (TrmA/RlmC/RlmD family)
VTSLDTAATLELETGTIAGGGGCVAHAPDGRVVFVRHSLPGERVVARVTATTSSFLRADAVEILSASPDRVPPPCGHAGPGRCGGCDFQHASPAAQRRLKASRVAEQLERIAGVAPGVEVEAVAGAEDGLGWRTRIRLGADADGRVGFRRHRSHDLEYVESCPIAHPDVMATGALGARWPGVKEIEVVVAPGRTDAFVAVDAVPRTKPTLPQLGTGLVLNGRVRQVPAAVNVTVAGVTFRVSAGVFWQVHVGAADALAAAARSALAAVPGDVVVDLYAGAGLFSVLLATDVGEGGSVLAVERDRRACADARHNGRRHPQLAVRQASITPRLVEQGIGDPTLVVLDPAREGAGTPVMAALSRLSSVRRLVYVSCDAGSFSRDIRVLLEAGWTMSSLRAFDIFPMTEHVELVAGFDAPT